MKWTRLRRGVYECKEGMVFLNNKGHGGWLAFNYTHAVGVWGGDYTFPTLRLAKAEVEHVKWSFCALDGDGEAI
jgi:hypothetical protein